MRTVWILDLASDFEVFERLEDARKVAEAKIDKRFDDNFEARNACKEEINRTYNEETGFHCDEVVWCWKIPYHI